RRRAVDGRGRGGAPAAGARARRERRPTRPAPAADPPPWTGGQVAAFEWRVERYREEFLNRQFSGAGLGPGAVPDRAEARQITAFVAWTAWTAAARRPDRPYSYTNSWPPQPLAG